MTETFGIVSSNNTTIHASMDMQAALRPLSWYHTIIGGHRCPITSVSTLSTVICATGLKYNINDPSASSILQRLLKHHEVISVNFIVKFPESHGYDTIMCVIDSLTKCAHFILTHTTINTEGTALLFLKEVWKHHGTPRAVVSDREPQFVTTFTHELYKLLGIKLAMSTAYHPQTDGQTECINQELEGYLHIFTS
jgi:hypothetical protein